MSVNKKTSFVNFPFMFVCMERGCCSPHCVHPAHFPAKYRFDAICPNFSFQLFLFIKWLEFKICKTKGKRKTAAGEKQTKPQSGVGWHSLLSTFSNVFSAVSTQKRFLPYFDVLKREDTWKGQNKNSESAGWTFFLWMSSMINSR